CHQENNWPYSF
nr:immunoglobulin light chain junction region [Macaca mulatta]MOV74308.1 immunoglobulin light chain junction region [Macaca mulatta]MOV75316.1 immunoglobulin light chain junction region [Macaca mulatta]MOV75335.1 immunoglobulin light chain junction region [Macaca mulatta]MOV75720.1 immunoglobulin light chain junction region [Macaca mulatta]